VSGDDVGTLRVWDVRTEKCVLGISAALGITALQTHSMTGTNDIWSQPLHLWYACGAQVFAYDLREATGPVVRAAQEPPVLVCEDEVNAIQVLDDECIVTGDDAGQVRWGSQQWQHEDALVTCLAQHEGLVWSGGTDCTVQAWKVGEDDPIHSFTMEVLDAGFNPPMVHHLCVLQNGTKVASLGDGSLGLIQQDGPVTRQPDAHAGAVACCAPLEEDGFLSTGNDGMIALWQNESVQGAWNHGSKPNDMSCHGGDTVFVADVSKMITKYTIF